MRILAVALALCNAHGAQKVFLKDAASALIPTGDYLYKVASATQGSSAQTCVTNTIAGNVTGQYWPSTTAGHIITKTGGGTKTIWVSAPLSAGFTISGTITPNLRGSESAAQANAGARYEVLRWNVATGGISSSLGLSTDDGLTEWGTTEAARTTPTLTPTSTGFNTGDRVVIIIYNDDGNGVTETASGRTMTIFYDGANAATGDTYLTFTENLTFSADSNNAPSRTAWRWLPALRAFFMPWEGRMAA